MRTKTATPSTRSDSRGTDLIPAWSPDPSRQRTLPPSTFPAAQPTSPIPQSTLRLPPAHPTVAGYDSSSSVHREIEGKGNSHNFKILKAKNLPKNTKNHHLNLNQTIPLKISKTKNAPSCPATLSFRPPTSSWTSSSYQALRPHPHPPRTAQTRSRRSGAPTRSRPSHPCAPRWRCGTPETGTGSTQYVPISNPCGIGSPPTSTPRLAGRSPWRFSTGTCTAMAASVSPPALRAL